jgi:hypothetical protein
MLPPRFNYFLFLHCTMPLVIFSLTFYVGPMLFTHHYVMRNDAFLTSTRAGLLVNPIPHSNSLAVALSYERKSYLSLLRLRIGVLISDTT